MKMSESIANISSALCKFQSECPAPKKNSINPHFKSKYAALDEIINTVTPHLTKNGLSQIQSTSTEGENIGVKTILLHESGEFLEFDTLWLPMGKVTAQGAGSSVTYARRYGLCAALGIQADEDDDGNAATDQAKGAKLISSKQIGMLKLKVNEFAQLRNKSDQDVYGVLNITDVKKLTEKDAEEIINTLDAWIENAKKQGA